MIIIKILKSFLDPLTLPHKINFHSRKLFHKIYQNRYDFINSYNKADANHNAKPHNRSFIAVVKKC